MEKLIKNLFFTLFLASVAVPGLSHARAGSLPFHGLTNNGSTCYQNSLCQAMFHCNAFRDRLISLFRDFPAICDNLVLRELGAVVQGLCQEGSDEYNPLALANQVWAQKNILGEEVFPPYRQADAEELFSIINDSFDSVGHPLKIGDGSRTATQIQCCSCHHTREHLGNRGGVSKMELCFPEVEHGGIAIDPEDTFSLDAMLTSTIGSQSELQGTDGIECDTCQAGDVSKGVTANIFGEYLGQPRYRYNALKRTSIQLDLREQFLLLQIKRFKKNPLNPSRNFKIGNPVVCPTGRISFKDSAGIDHTFIIDSLVMHSGSLSAGHYFELSRNGYCSDSRAIPGAAPFEEALRTGRYDGAEIYMMMCSRDGYVPAPLPEPRVIVPAVVPADDPSFDESAEGFSSAAKGYFGVYNRSFQDGGLCAAATAKAEVTAVPGASWLKTFKVQNSLPAWLTTPAKSMIGAGVGLVTSLVVLTATGYLPPNQLLADATLLLPTIAGGVAGGMTKSPQDSRKRDRDDGVESEKGPADGAKKTK